MESNLDCMGDWDINGYVNVENTLKSILKSSSSVKVIDDDQFVSWPAIFFSLLYIVFNMMMLVLITNYFFNLGLV